MKRLGEILIEHGCITQKQLEEALDQQKKEKGKLLGEVLIEFNYVSEEDIVVALATQFNVPYLPIGNFTISDTAVQLIPKELIQKHLCVPLDKIGNIITVVMADPTNQAAITEIESKTDCKLQPFVGSVTEISTAIQEHFGIELNQSSKPGEKVSQVSFRSAVDNKKESK